MTAAICFFKQARLTRHGSPPSRAKTLPMFFTCSHRRIRQSWYNSPPPIGEDVQSRLQATSITYYNTKSYPDRRCSDYSSAHDKCRRRIEIGQNRVLSVSTPCARLSRCTLTPISHGRDRRLKQHFTPESRCEQAIGAGWLALIRGVPIQLAGRVRIGRSINSRRWPGEERFRCGRKSQPKQWSVDFGPS
jgi:hypothetical protein